jgi:D-glycero-D-manno-heptose 1,7-bisphosphate phosphatase
VNKLVILDRDGVINQDSDHFVKTTDEWQPIAGSTEAIARLSEAGFTVAVATNQSGLARGHFDEPTLAAMHDKMHGLVADAGGEIAGVFYCPHGPDDGCDCRKPLPGLIDQIEQALTLSARGAYLIGDSLRDLEAGLIKGCTPILVRTGKGERTLQKLAETPVPELEQLLVFDDLAAACDHIIGETL